MEVKDKVAIITGASSGIGEATARLLSKKGAKVVLVARSFEKLEKLSKTLPGSFVVVCDMTVPEQIKKMVEKVLKKYGQIDILVNNAGQGYDATIENININTFHNVFDLDVVGPLVAIQEVVPIMKKQKEGSIINISSGTALMALPNMAAYSSLKRAVAGISLTAREEFKKNNISVTVIYPYITETDFEKNTIRDGKQEWPEDGEGYTPPPSDPPDYIAGKILDAIKSGASEVYAHDWMNPKNSKEQ
ncbi:MAG: SDR family NAD(P)-dependent oxidoreductase [Candidatus Levyibacteriota bacterium]